MSEVLPSGSLSDRRAAGLIFDLADTDATGTLSLSYGKVRKDLYVRHGCVVAADSNLRREALGTLLCAKGIIDDRQLAYLLAETKTRRHKMGAVLVELGWLTPEEVLQALAAQARKRIADCLRWHQGSFAFIAGDTFGDRVVEHDLGIANLVFLGLYRSATPEWLVERFDQSGACPVKLTPRFDRYREPLAQVFGGDLPSILADEPSIGALALRDDAHVVMAQVDALVETGLATLGQVSPESTAGPPRLTSSFSLEKLGSEPHKRSASTQESGAMSFANLRKDEIPPATSHAYSPDLAGGASSSTLAIPSAPTRGDSVPVEERRQVILREYLMIHGKDHYEVLGVGRQASRSQIERAVADKLDKLAGLAGPASGAALAPADSARLEAVRSAIAQAGEVLCHPEQRAKYDGALASLQATSIDPLGAELEFREGTRLLQAERFGEALARFAAAVTARPDQALYHAYLGWTDLLAHGPAHKTEARERLDHALALDPELADAHAMLGRLAASEDDASGARTHLERSLAIEPDQPGLVDLLLEAYARLPEPDPDGAARFLRGLVSSLGERAEPLRKRLWLALGTIYDSLGDQASARVAQASAARMGAQGSP